MAAYSGPAHIFAYDAAKNLTATLSFRQLIAYISALRTLTTTGLANLKHQVVKQPGGAAIISPIGRFYSAISVLARGGAVR